MGFLGLALSFIYPLKCSLCGELMAYSENLICGECLKSLPITYSKPVFPMGEDTKKNKERFFYCVISPFYYVNNVRLGILSLKFFGRTKTALFLSGYMADAVLHSPFYNECDAIVFVPSSKKRKSKRGYNQSELLATHLAKKINLPILKDTLLRIKDSPPQSKAKNRKERLLNVKGAFEVLDGNNIQNKTILLVDDIVTTGATLNECSKMLKNAGAKRILCLTAARTRVIKGKGNKG
jgi:ComF family protein